jgi:hypothetical protein
MQVLVRVVLILTLYGYTRAERDATTNGFRRIYARKEGSKSLGSVISTTEAKSQGFKPEANAQKVPVAPKDMKYKGYTAAYWNKMGFKN